MAILQTILSKMDNLPTMFLLQRLHSVSKPKKSTQSVPHGISSSLFVLFIQHGKWHQLGTSLRFYILKQRDTIYTEKTQYFHIKHTSNSMKEVGDIPLASTIDGHIWHLHSIDEIRSHLYCFNKILISTCCGPKLQPCLIRPLAQMLCSFSASFSTSSS